MPLNILVTSPLPLPMDRNFRWGESIIWYDSGASQGSTPYVRHLIDYAFGISNMERSKQSSLYAFWNQQKGAVTPFLMKDPYDQTLTLVVAAGSGTSLNSGSNLRAKDARSWNVIPDSSGFSVISTLSGTLTASTHYVLSADNGNIYWKITKASTDTFRIDGSFFRKVRFKEYRENSFLWNEFSGSVVIEEMIP